MAGGSNGCRAALVRRQLTPGLISSLAGTAALQPFISFSTSYPELESAVRRPLRRIGNGEEYLVVAGVPRFQAAAHRRRSTVLGHDDIWRRPAGAQSQLTFPFCRRMSCPSQPAPTNRSHLKTLRWSSSTTKSAS